ncbi:hypothetical protein CDAR_407691 [Caerostris darwini]|uniref:Uncharacterized protein n=1 Tax=Caerostris darwini TaxID=1538125 RepID=A0AAV4Q3N8_9ARAC|nr:hypothetical protein CDAR_407691 [Caerostris darwini]
MAFTSDDRSLLSFPTRHRGLIHQEEAFLSPDSNAEQTAKLFLCFLLLFYSSESINECALLSLKLKKNMYNILKKCRLTDIVLATFPSEYVNKSTDSFLERF